MVLHILLGYLRDLIGAWCIIKVYADDLEQHQGCHPVCRLGIVLELRIITMGLWNTKYATSKICTTVRFFRWFWVGMSFLWQFWPFTFKAVYTDEIDH